MKIAEDLYAYEWTNFFENNCNSFYIGGDVRALIDPGLLSHVPALLERMEEDGIETDKIRYIINTHSHPDHYEGAAYFSKSEAQIALHKTEIDFMKEGGKILYDWFEMRPPNVKPSFVLDSGEIQLGGERFEVHLSPGHSPGSVALYWPARKALFSGDVIFEHNVGRTDFPGGSGKLLKESIKKLSLIDADYLLPGHMGLIAGNEAVRKNFEIVIRSVLPYI